MNLVNTVPMPGTGTAAPLVQPKDTEKTAVQTTSVIEEPKDTVEISKPNTDTDTKVDFKGEKAAEPPKISRIRLMFSKLTDDQIKAVNESKMLPENAKFQFGGKVICNNWFGFSAGTRKLLPGYELKKNIFGFTIVVPEGTKGLFVKKTPEEKAAKLAEKAEKVAVKSEVKAEVEKAEEQKLSK